MYAPVFFRSSV
jgi:hypothetical protein